MFKNKNPTILTNGGETINFSINLSGRYRNNRIANVKCIECYDFSIIGRTFRAFNPSVRPWFPSAFMEA